MTPVLSSGRRRKDCLKTQDLLSKGEMPQQTVLPSGSILQSEYVANCLRTEVHGCPVAGTIDISMETDRLNCLYLERHLSL